VTLADDLLPVVFDARSIAGDLGFRPHSVAVVIEYANETTGQGGITSERTPIVEAQSQNPRIVWEKSDDVPFGNAPSNIIMVGPVTPSDSLDEIFTRELGAGESRLLIVTGPNNPDGERFAIVDYDASRPLRRMIRAQGMEQALQGFTT
jgi:hypothetical protein